MLLPLKAKNRRQDSADDEKKRREHDARSLLQHFTVKTHKYLLKDLSMELHKTDEKPYRGWGWGGV